MADACTRFAPGAEQRHHTLTAPGTLLAQKTVRPHYLLAGACGTAVCASPEARRAELRSGPELWRTTCQRRNTPRTDVFLPPHSLLVVWVCLAVLVDAWARVMARPQTERRPVRPLRTQVGSATASRSPACPKLLERLRTGI